jgi:chromatin remodeling complex protein RSC6
MAAVARVLRGSMFLMSPAAGTAAGAKAAGAAAAKKKTKAASTKPRAPSGITKPMPVSDEFSRFAGGAPEVARSQAMKLVWAHIKAHGLQVARRSHHPLAPPVSCRSGLEPLAFDCVV